MFKNPNYEWLLDYEKPSDPLFGGFYWMYMYNKLFSQGTDEDRYELEQLYNKYQSHAPFPFNIVTGLFEFGEVYEKVVNSFTYDRQMEHYNDERERKNRSLSFDKDKFAKSLHKSQIELYGYDRNLADKQSKIDENRLNAEHTDEQNEFEKDPESNLLIRYGCGHYLKNGVRILREEDIEIQCYNGTSTTIHAVLFDKYKGFYNAAIYCDADVDENGKPIVHQCWSYKYSYTEIQAYTIYGKKLEGQTEKAYGIEGLYRLFLDDYKEMARLNLFKYAIDYQFTFANPKYNKNNDKEAKKSKKAVVVNNVEDVDISKIQQALGITEGEDDLNGNIF